MKKKYTILGISSTGHADRDDPKNNMIPFDVDVMRRKQDVLDIYGYEFTADEHMQVTDGYHTMDELYDHRIELFIKLAEHFIYGKRDSDGKNVWRSKLHEDGSMFTGWFVMGIGKKEGEQITYHLPRDRWDETGFAETLDRAPKFDGHTSEDVLERLKTL